MPKESESNEAIARNNPYAHYFKKLENLQKKASDPVVNGISK